MTDASRGEDVDADASMAMHGGESCSSKGGADASKAWYVRAIRGRRMWLRRCVWFTAMTPRRGVDAAMTHRVGSTRGVADADVAPTV